VNTDDTPPGYTFVGTTEGGGKLYVAPEGTPPPGADDLVVADDPAELAGQLAIPYHRPDPPALPWPPGGEPRIGVVCCGAPLPHCHCTADPDPHRHGPGSVSGAGGFAEEQADIVNATGA
jgi:hypothetical protein